MQTDQIYDSAPNVSSQNLAEWEKSNDYNLPNHYRKFLLSRNGGHVQISMSGFADGDSLINMFPVRTPLDHAQVEQIIIQEFDENETLLPKSLQPLLKIGRARELDLHLSLNPASHGQLVRFSLSHDEYFVLECTLNELLNQLGPDERSTAFEPKAILGAPWDLIRIGQYEEIFAAIVGGIHIDAHSPNDKLELTMLMMALRACRKSLTEELLVHHANANAIDSNGTPALFYSRRFCDGLKLLIDAGADINVADANGNSILHTIADETHCLTGGDPRVVAWIVENEGNIKAINQAGKTPLDIANQKLEEFKVHYIKQPHMLAYIPESLKHQINLLGGST